MKQTETLYEIKMFCYQSATSEQQCGEKYITKLRKSRGIRDGIFISVYNFTAP